jgi:hypothetical protein
MVLNTPDQKVFLVVACLPFLSSSHLMMCGGAVFCLKKVWEVHRLDSTRPMDYANARL